MLLIEIVKRLLQLSNTGEEYRHRVYCVGSVVVVRHENEKVNKEPWREIVDFNISAIGLCQEVIYCS